MDASFGFAAMFPICLFFAFSFALLILSLSLSVGQHIGVSLRSFVWKVKSVVTLVTHTSYSHCISYQSASKELARVRRAPA